MADLQQLERALINADAAGDVEAAKALAAELKKMRAAPAEAPQKEESFLDQAKRFTQFATPAHAAASLLTSSQARKDAIDGAAGAIRGAGSIGATLMYPIDKAIDMVKGDRDPTITGLVTGQQPISRNQERRQQMNAGLRSMGIDTDSTYFDLGKLGGEIAGTGGIGPALAGAVRSVPLLSKIAPNVTQKLASAIETGGFRLGSAPAATLPGKAGNALLRVGGGAVTGGASAGLVNPEDAGLGAAIGGAVPGLAQSAGWIGNKAGKLLRGEGISEEVQALAKRAKDLGINIPADRLVDSKPMNALASSLNYVPFSGRAATESKMTSQLNKALSKTFGQDSDNVTAALRKADDVLGSKFDEFLSSNTVNVDRQFITDLTDAANQASKELGSDGASIIGKQVEEILEKAANGVIDGQAAYNIKKTLDRIGKRNSPEAWYALDLKQKLMEALDRSVGPEKAAAFKGLRQQYGNMLSLQKLATNGAEGEISIGRLANMKNIRSPEIQELADISAQFLKSREGNHGAMQRAMVGIGAGGYAGIPALVGGVMAGRGTNMLLNSNLARNAVLGTTDPMITNNLMKLLEVGGRTAPVVSAQ